MKPIDIAFKVNNKVMQVLLFRDANLRSGPSETPERYSLSKIDMVTEFPRNLWLLGSKLKTLDLSFLPISIHSSIANFVSLNILILKSMNLGEFPECILSLIHLKTLNVNNNRIRILPKDISVLESLEVLKIKNNLLEFLPSSLIQMKLTRLAVQNNPLQTIPREIIMRGSSATLDYLRVLSSSKNSTWKKIKLLVLGQEAVGKTSLVTALTNFAKRSVHFLSFSFSLSVSASPSLEYLSVSPSASIPPSPFVCPFQELTKKTEKRM